MLSFERPADFNPKFEAVSCYLVNNGKILLLQRHEDKPQGKQWGTPAGKIEEGETSEEAVVREVAEETGMELDAGSIHRLKSAFVVFPDYDFVWHMFRSNVSETNVTIKRDEHSSYVWVTPNEALGMDLVMDEETCIKEAFAI